jgi:hypothetical protein
MRFTATATLVAAAMLLAPTAAIAAHETKTTVQASATTATRTAGRTTTTTPASIPTTSITTTTSGGTSTTLPLAPPRAANLASARVAITAYATYLRTLVGSESASQADDAAYVSTVESGCRSSLEPLTQSGDAARPDVQNTLTALGKEIGDDLAISYDEVASTPFNELATVLERLRWVHGGRNTDVISGYITAETAMIGLSQSGLCQDALLAAAKPAVTPGATRTFLTEYEQTARTASTALGGFLELLHAYATAAERPLLQRITALAKEFATDSRTNLLASGQQLTTSLETS